VDTTVNNAHPTLEAGVGRKATAGGGDQHVNRNRQQEHKTTFVYFGVKILSVFMAEAK
jgi:hypothetical protein